MYAYVLYLAFQVGTVAARDGTRYRHPDKATELALRVRCGEHEEE